MSFLRIAFAFKSLHIKVIGINLENKNEDELSTLQSKI